MKKSKFTSDEEKIRFIENLNAKVADEPKKESGNTLKAEPEFSLSYGNKDSSNFSSNGN